jgi:hypothetical protein
MITFEFPTFTSIVAQHHHITTSMDYDLPTMFPSPVLLSAHENMTICAELINVKVVMA